MERSRFLLSILLLLGHYGCIYVAKSTLGTGAAQTNITTDQGALLALKAHITGDPENILVNWSATTSVCNWVGVTCGARHLRVSVLNLSYMGLTGTIPPNLGNLSFLVEMRFRNNSFHGTLPHELSYLRRLKLISFGYNNFMGIIPLWFGSFPKLQSFNLYGNQFSGSIPSTIFNLSTLQVIDLSENQLSGTEGTKRNRELNNAERDVPEVQQFQRALYMHKLLVPVLGHVPVGVFNMSSLTTLNLYGNNLNGGLPDNICQHLPSL
ncbi:putative LRR receptor-like serine/threonine-protein kinase [Prunus yedoensis var. nudiflora]|uniref:Putative LRR receptor-like serine/threonine-protein kinase n=1 Tax=Prunus yedoensis var. nudiflora TaxID=2094558 RepID=A0A314YIH5_PRUYE|nr:putative LRR receptor-like serine/threonine-protein kinase [Prunus yedoensis var. nudiflora]